MSSPVEQIKQRLGVVDVVQSYIKLDKAGVNFKARCPFHSEKTASFFVSPPRDIWHCFGCNRGGDIFGFVMEMEGVEFVEALKILAERAGIKLKTEDPRLRNERTRLLDLMKEAVDFYRKKLIEHQEALLYLRKRGLEDSTIQLYLLGYAPPESYGWRNLYEHLLGKGYFESEMEKTGLIIKSDKQQSNYYDRFRGRIMFPIFDFSGRVVGFSGRLYPEDSRGPSSGTQKDGPLKAKYINSPQTVLYDKSKILYGFDKAKTEIRKKDACVLVEGQMDVLMSHQAGVLNAVAVSGIGLTPYHLESVSRLTNNLIVCFDNDEAGLIAASRGIDIVNAQTDNPAPWQMAMLAAGKGFEVRSIVLPFGKDPADVASKDPSAWQKAVEESCHIIDFYLRIFSEKIKEPRELKRKVEQVVLPQVFLIESEIEKSHWVKEIAKCLNIGEDPIWEQLKKMKIKKMEIKLERLSSKTRRQILEERLIGIAFWQNNANIVSDKYFFDRYQSLLKDLKARKKTADGERFALEAELYYGEMKTPELKREIEILANELERENIKEKLAEVMENIRKFEAVGDEKSLGEYLGTFNELTKRLNQIRQLADSPIGE